jgi:hypothetical protein
MLYYREAATIIFLMSQEAMMLNHCKIQVTIARVTITWPMQQSNIYTLLITKMIATSILCYVISQEAMTMMVDCAKECKIAPLNNQPNIYIALRKQATIAKCQHHQCDNHFLFHTLYGKKL